MKKALNDKEWKNLTDEYSKVTYKCKCGHSVVIPHWKDKSICGWCGNYVFKNKKDEFDYKIKNILKKEME